MPCEPKKLKDNPSPGDLFTNQLNDPYLDLAAAIDLLRDIIQTYPDGISTNCYGSTRWRLNCMNLLTKYSKNPDDWEVKINDLTSKQLRIF